MSKKANQRKVYVRQLKQWVEMDGRVYEAYQKPIDAHRKRMQYHGRCACPKSRIWLCDGDCGTCEFSRAGDLVYLDEPFGDGSCTMFDLIEDEHSDIETILIDRELLDTLIAKLNELDPEGRRICELLMEDKDEREIAKLMGFKSQSSVNYRKRKAFARLRELLNGLV